MNSPATALSGHCVRERARAYIAKLPPSIQGSRGSDALFAAATALVRGFSLPPEEAFPLLAEWNAAHAVPPWSVRELQYKQVRGGGIAPARRLAAANGAAPHCPAADAAESASCACVRDSRPVRFRRCAGCRGRREGGAPLRMAALFLSDPR